MSGGNQLAFLAVDYGRYRSTQERGLVCDKEILPNLSLWSQAISQAPSMLRV
jgi:hypothetical protein